MKKIEQYIHYLSGMAILTLGIAILINVDLGPSTWDASNVGLSEQLGISVGLANFIMGLFLVATCAVIRKGWPNILVVVAALLTSVFINFWLSIPLISFFANASTTVIAFGYAFFGLILMAIGINVYVKAAVAPNPIDYLMLTINEQFNISFTKAKIITDFSGLLIALLLGGPIGIFTVIIMLTLGVFVGYFEKVYYKIFVVKF